jgi:hypothetical protein
LAPRLGNWTTTEEQNQIDVGTASLPERLDVPDEPNGRVVAVLPGSDHGPYDDIFDDFAEAAAGDGYHVLRYESWSDEQDPDEEKTLAQIHDEYEAAVKELLERGCTRVDVVGKSVGAPSYCYTFQTRSSAWSCGRRRRRSSTTPTLRPSGPRRWPT